MKTMSFIGKRRLAPAVFLLAVLVCHKPPATAQDMPTEQSVRAAMVFNFLKFAEWPGAAGERMNSLRLCVVSGDPQQVQALESLAGRQVRGVPLAVAKVGSRAGGCNVLYVDSRPRWIEALEGGAVGKMLTISSYSGFVRDGGMLEIGFQDGSPRFDVNLAEVRRAGLRLYPQLLQLARKVHE